MSCRHSLWYGNRQYLEQIQYGNLQTASQRAWEKVAEYLQRNDISTLHIILLGDAAHGACHVTCRVKSEEDVCDQIMHVSELYAEVINELSKY